MHLTGKSNQPKREVLRVILDEPRLYIEESLGSVLVRGEVIVNFEKDTHIQGPIELLFEGIQRFITWPEIMRYQASGSPIETKLQVTELTLLPPNSKGIMPAGIQRFPFEFPIPASLPTSVYIRDRIEIFYQLSATIRRSTGLEAYESNNPINWLDWARRNASSKKKYTACSPIRVVRAMESIVSSGLPSHTAQSEQQQHVSPDNNTISNTDLSTSTTPEDLVQQLPWNRRGLNEYQVSLDEQHDQLAYSLSGRTSNNLSQSPHMLDKVHGIRYKIGIDRTAIAIGTSVGIELMIEPTFSKAVIKSVVLKIAENRKYAMKVPSDHNSWSTNSSHQTKRINEGAKMILKWAYGYEAENDDGEYSEQKSLNDNSSQASTKYVRKRSCSSPYLAYFDPPQPGSPSSKSFLGNQINNSDCKPHMILDSEVQESSSSSFASHHRDMINLKELNQSVEVGEYFGGRFVMPVPDCSNILNPSMEYESINIDHWLQLVITIECEGKNFDLLLESPARVLDCRVVSVDDECQTILPPPPSYNPGDGHLYQENTLLACTFWEQREAITSVSGWGSCAPCPCQYKKLKKLKQSAGNSTTTCNVNNRLSSSGGTITGPCPPNLMPEWGPPPCYSEN